MRKKMIGIIDDGRKVEIVDALDLHGGVIFVSEGAVPQWGNLEWIDAKHVKINTMEGL